MIKNGFFQVREINIEMRVQEKQHTRNMAAAIKARVEREYAAAEDMISHGHKECPYCYNSIGAMLFHSESECKTKPICYNEKGEELAAIDTEKNFKGIDHYSAGEYYDWLDFNMQYYGTKAIEAVFGTHEQGLELECKIRLKKKEEHYYTKEAKKMAEENAKLKAEEEKKEAAKKAAANAGMARLAAAVTAVEKKGKKDKKPTVEKFSLDEI